MCLSSLCLSVSLCITQMQIHPRLHKCTHIPAECINTVLERAMFGDRSNMGRAGPIEGVSSFPLSLSLSLAHTRTRTHTHTHIHTNTHICWVLTGSRFHGDGDGLQLPWKLMVACCRRQAAWAATPP